MVCLETWKTDYASLCSNSKISPTQPGRGIRKVADLYHEISDLLVKADKFAAVDALEPEELAELNNIDFLGLTAEEIEEEHKE
jgi:hypothetical protein